jgi:outer membrane lipoprotein carrier protein
MPFLRQILLSSMSLFIFFNTYADPSATKDFLTDLAHNRYLTGQFVQISTLDSAIEPTKQTGEFALKPNQFRWIPKDPQQTRVIADGEKIYVYDTGLNQVTVSTQHTAQTGSPAMFLVSDTKDIMRHYDVSETTEKNTDCPYAHTEQTTANITYIVTPKQTMQEHSLFDRLIIRFSGAAPERTISAMCIVDKLNGINKIYFTVLTKNPSNRLFVFTPPPGVEIVKGN